VSVLPLLLAGGCGILLDARSPEAVAAAVRACLEDVTRYREMSTRAERTAQQYSLEQWRDRIGAFLTAAWGQLRGDVSQSTTQTMHEHAAVRS
jgi:hypothetical protein